MPLLKPNIALSRHFFLGKKEFYGYTSWLQHGRVAKIGSICAKIRYNKCGPQNTRTNYGLIILPFSIVFPFREEKGEIALIYKSNFNGLFLTKLPTCRTGGWISLVYKSTWSISIKTNYFGFGDFIFKKEIKILISLFCPGVSFWHLSLVVVNTDSAVFLNRFVLSQRLFRVTSLFDISPCVSFPLSRHPSFVLIKILRESIQRFV